MSKNKKNKITKQKSKFNAFTIFIVLMVIFLDCYFVFSFSEVKVKSNEKNMVTLLNLTDEKISKEPFKVDIKNEKIQKEFLNNQKKLIVLYILILMYVHVVNASKKNEFKGIEHGSANWADKNEMKEFNKKDGGIVLSNELFLDPANRKYNLNQLTIGGSGAGKSFFKAKPDIMQLNCSYVVTDPKGEIYRDTNSLLEMNGYKIKVLNLIEPRYSNGYNPFNYIHDEKDVLITVDVIMKNTTDPKKSGGDEFWEQSQKALLQALVYYLWRERPKSEQNIENILRLVTSAKVSEDGEETDNPLENIFTELEERDSSHIAVRSYNVFKLAAGKTAKSILVSLAVRLSIWNTQDIAIMTNEDEMELDKVGTEKTAIFIIIPENFDTFKVIACMFYSQLFQTLFYEADFKHGGKLPILVNCILDEFANVGEIPMFDKLIAVMRSRNVCVVPIIQALSQLKTLYKDSWQTIIGCCDTFNFLGTTDQETLEYVSKKLGKTTVRVDTKGISKGKSSSRSDNTSYVARDLMTPTELFEMDKENSIVFIKGHKPFFTEKFKTPSHKHFKFVTEEYHTDIKEEFAEIAEVKEVKYREKQLEMLRETLAKAKEKEALKKEEIEKIKNEFEEAYCEE